MLLVLSVSSCAILSQLFCHVNLSRNTLPLCFGRCYFFSFRCVLFTLLFFHPLAVKKLILLSPHQAGGVGKLVNAVLEKEVT